MNRIFTKSIALIALVGAFTLGAPTKSEAAFTMWLCDQAFCSGGTVTIISDNGAGDLTAATTGRITAFMGGVGGFNAFDVEIGLTKPEIGSAGSPEMDLSFNALSAGAAEAWLYISDTDFTGITSLSINIGGTTQGTVWSALYGGSDNTLGTLAGPIASIGPFSGGAFSGASAGAAVGSVANPYALTYEVHIKHAGAGLTTGDGHVIPEPGMLALLGLGLAGLAQARRRKA